MPKPENAEPSNLAVPAPTDLVAMDPEAKTITPAPPAREADVEGAPLPTEDALHLTLTAHYFPLGNAYLCYACKKPEAKVHTIRVTRTMRAVTLVTPMCEECATAEVDGVLERGDMVVSDDGRFLIAPAADDINKKMAEYQEQQDAAAENSQSGE